MIPNNLSHRPPLAYSLLPPPILNWSPPNTECDQLSYGVTVQHLENICWVRTSLKSGCKKFKYIHKPPGPPSPHSPPSPPSPTAPTTPAPPDSPATLHPKHHLHHLTHQHHCTPSRAATRKFGFTPFLPSFVKFCQVFPSFTDFWTFSKAPPFA